MQQLPPADPPYDSPDTKAGRTSAFPLRIALIYLAFSLIWIWSTDALVWLGLPLEHGFLVSAIKGTLFVALSAMLIYWLVRREFQTVYHANALLRAITDGTTDAVFVKDRDGKYLLFNEAAARFVGKSINEVLGRDDTELFDSNSARRLMERDRQIMATGRAATHEEELTTVGLTRIYLATKAPYRDDKGNVIGIIGISRDITERRQSERRFRELADAIPQIVWTALPDGSMTHLNKLASDYTGVTIDELTGWSWERVIHPDDRPQTIAEWTEVLRSGQPQDIEFRIRRTDGEYRWHIGRQVPIRDGSGSIIAWYGTCTEIEDLKLAEIALRDERTLLRTLIDAIPDLIFTKDMSGRFALCNRALLEFTGAASEAQLAGKTVFDLFPPEQARGYHADDLQVTVQGDNVLDREELARDATGRETWRLVNKTPLKDHTGNIIGLVGISRNIQQRREREQRLAESQERLKLAISAARMGAWDWDFRTNHVYRSPECVAILGAEYLPEELDAFRRVLHPDDFDAVFAATDLAISGTSEFDMEYRIVRPDGEIRWLHDVAKIHNDKSGTPVRMVGMFHDITDRKHAEDAVRKSEQELRDRERLLGIVTGSARVGLVVVSDRYQYLFANEAYAEIFGLDVSAIVGSRVYDLLAAGWLQIQPQLDRALAGERVSYELTIPSPPSSDSARLFRVMYEPRMEETGRATVVVVVMEVTEQKRAEKVILESEERYRRLVDVLPDALFVHTGRELIFCNPTFVRLMGAQSADELVGMSPYNVAHRDHHSVVRTRLDSMTKTGEAMPGIEMRIVRTDGRSVPVYSVAAPITGYGPTAFLVVLSDLTERERSMELLRSVLGSVNDAILTIDSHGTVHSANAATERTFGYSAAELIGKNIKRLMPPPYRDEHDEYIGNFLRTGVAKIMGKWREVEGLRKDGSTFPVELTVTEFQRDGERHFTGVVRDITARKRLEAQFQQAQKMEAVGRLAGGIAHDFNNLLTIINGHGDLLMMELNQEDRRRESVLAIVNAGDRAARLTQQLLAFSRKAIIELKVLDLNEMVLESAKMLRRLIEEDIMLTVVPNPSLPRIKADPGQLEQVLMNLVVNARDAMASGGRMVIETRNVTLTTDHMATFPDLKPGPYVELAVQDSGHGMTEEIASKIFEPFFTTKGVGKGTGLGLSVVHGVVTQCGGGISVESKVDIGTTFRLLFPAVEDVAKSFEPRMTHAATGGDETILLVEDDSAVRQIAKIGLVSAGYEVLEAASGEEADRIADEYPGTISLLLTDVVMPIVGGRKLAEALRRRYPQLKVLYMSGYTDDAVLHRGVVEANEAFLQKPFTPYGLARKVRAVLDGVT